MEERKYQSDIQDSVRRSMLNGHKAILVQLSTGGGKTHLAAGMIATALAKGKTSHFAVHRKILTKQTALTFDEHKIPYSYIAAGHVTNPYNRVHICSIDTLKSRLHTIKIPDILWVDEAHMANSAGWSEVIDHYRAGGAWIILLTATPVRTDGTGLGKHATAMVCGPSMRWLIDNGFLSDYKMFSPSSMNLKGVHTRMGDYARGELADMLDNNGVIIGDAIKHYQKYAPDTLNITYCVSRKHSEYTAELFRNAGVTAMHIDGETPEADRKRIIAAYARREIKVLTNVDLITTGFDLAAQVGADINVESISLVRPTQSLSLYLQMVGRGLRRKPKPAIILDHANNLTNHGLPDDEYVWTLADREVKKKNDTAATVHLKHCPMCYRDHRPAPICPQCGFVYEIQYREVEQREGELKEIDKAALRLQTRMKAETLDMQYKAGDYEDKDMDYLVMLGKKRGYKNPERWAAYIITSRIAKGKRK